jgi:ankyrin repeat protein
MLLALGSDIEELDRQDKTPLAHAVLSNNEVMVKLLLEKGANTEALKALGSQTDRTGRFQNAIGSRNENAVRLLLVMGADVKDRRFVVGNMTPLLYAAYRGKLAIVKILEAGADMKARDKYGWTVLHQQSIKNRPNHQPSHIPQCKP